MRIEKLSFKNINSLEGHWSIDFTHEGLNTDGLFLITGATGSGKTTILDAICIALFGRTPRLSALTAGENGAITKGQKDCFCEVIFSVDGKCYRSKWSQRYKNPRKGHPATLDKPVRELSYYPSEELFAGNAKDLAAKVVEIIGMSYEQFSKSVMLAQGDFARFLKASDNDRAAILEQITGTNIYSDISKKIFERSKNEDKKLELMDVELNSMQLLGNEERLQAKMELQAGLDKEKALETEIKQGQALLQKASALKKAQEQALSLKQQHETLKNEELAFAPNLKELELQEKLTPLLGQYEVLTHSRKSLKETQDKLEHLEKDDLPKAQDTLELNKKLEQEKAVALLDAKGLDEKSAPIIDKARDHEKELSAVDESLKKQQELLKKSQDAFATLKKKQQSSGNLLKKKQKAQKDILNRIASIPNAQSLEAEISVIAHMFSELKQKKQQLLDRNAALEKVQKALKSVDSKAKKAKSAHEKSLADLEKIDAQYLLAKANLDQNLGSLDEEQMGKIMLSENALLSEFDHFENDVDVLKSSQEEYEKLKLELEKNKKKQEKLAKEITNDERNLKALEDSANNAKIALDSLYDLQKAFYLSKKLKPNEPCPCCGSREHPLLPQDPVLDKKEAEYKEKYEVASKTFDDAQRALLKKKEKFSKAQGKLDESTLNVESANKRLQDICSRLKNALCVLQDKFSLLQELDDSLSFDMSILQRTLNEKDAEGFYDAIVALELQVKAGNLAHQHKLKLIKEQKSALAELADKKMQLATNVSEEKLTLSKLELEAQNTQDSVKSAQDERNFAQNDYQGLKGELANKIASFDFATEDAIENTPQDVLDELNKLCESFKALSQDEARVKDEISRLETELTKLNEDLEAKQDEQELLDGEYKALERRQQNEVASLKALIGDKSATQFEKALKDKVEKARTLHEKALEAFNQSQNNLAALNSAIDENTQSIKKLKEDLEGKELSFKQDLEHLELKDEAEFKSHLMEESARKDLADKAKDLNNRRSSLDTLLEQNSKQLSELEPQVPKDIDEKALELALSQKEEDHKQVLKRNGSLAQALSDDDKRRAQKNEKLVQRELQDKCCSRWRALNEMAGSASGDKFKMFAQELTLKALIAEANAELKIFNERYILTQSTDPKEPLHFNVIDTWHDGHSRGVENLSGGESFIISLALALAISHMAHGRHSIETLFLDEGFGTLDPKSLDTALNALVQLNSRHSGLIGIISHIEQLRDSISAKIVVERRPDGFSKLSGPGCQGKG